MASRSDTAANLAVLVMCAAVSVTAISRVWQPHAVRVFAHPYKVGDTFDLMPPDEFDRADLTMLMVVQSQCGFCTESMPFYRRLMTLRPQVAGRVRFVAVSLDQVKTGRAYLAEHGVEPDAVLPYPPSTEIRLQGTPTILVIDRARTIVGLWTGKLEPSQEHEVEQTLLGSEPAS